ncbi:hypothetical protein ACFQZE_07050 [Paenibacillus sp. GCM10027627]|uniref:hypothetical protein n=1 Tax=unclassified Paenibacillus TaxID=185978 RepID=UPI0036420840
MNTAFEVVYQGYNAIIQNGVEFKIVGGNGEILNIREHDDSEVLSVNVSQVQKFVTVL